MVLLCRVMDFEVSAIRKGQAAPQWDQPTPQRRRPAPQAVQK